ncbi:MAG: succinate dehydrogenase cytochrome b subunit [Planctomycetes bacterium]|nr:succinate dehydrogenase cytochrome b subunit [Planctomycetota bacterium]
MKWLSDCWRSSIGGKLTMAVTGLLLFLFLIAHLLGNLQLLAGPDAINDYAHFLKGKPALVWSARLGLLVVFLLHVVTGIRLARENKVARPVPYARPDTIQASWASRSMVLTGLSTLVFVVYHLLHFTVGVTNPGLFDQHTATGHHDVYAMVTDSFAVPGIALAYIAFQVVLFFHLSHGVQSLAQTLGIHHERYTPMIKTASIVLAVLITGGNIFLVLSVLTGMTGGQA